MSSYSIPLAEIEEYDGPWRVMQMGSPEFPEVPQNNGNDAQDLVARIETLLICNGKLKSGENGTLIIFRFTFGAVGNVLGQRFSSARIMVQFSHSLERTAKDPGVVKVWPRTPQIFDIVIPQGESDVGVNIKASIGGTPEDIAVEILWKPSENRGLYDHYASLSIFPLNAGRVATPLDARHILMNTSSAIRWRLSAQADVEKEGHTPYPPDSRDIAQGWRWQVSDGNIHRCKYN